MKRLIPFHLIAIAILSSCSSGGNNTASKPDWVLSEDKMVDIIVDMRIADAAVFSNPNTPPRDKVKDWKFIMHKYHISDTLFRQSHDYYAEHPEEAEAIYERVIDRLNEMVADNQDN